MFTRTIHTHREENRDEEIRYIMFTLAQFLGFVEVVRREGPRERPFLQSGSSQVCLYMGELDYNGKETASHACPYDTCTYSGY